MPIEHISADIAEQAVPSLAQIQSVLNHTWPSLSWSRLTRRELQVAYLWINGLSEADSADELGLVPKTVQTYRHNIRIKFRLPRPLLNHLTMLSYQAGSQDLYYATTTPDPIVGVLPFNNIPQWSSGA